MKARLNRVEWLILAAIIATLSGILLSGCGPSVQRSPDHAPWFHGGPAGVLTGLALIATALAGTGLIACAFLAMFYPDKLKVAKLAVACITIIIGAQITYWLGAHLVLATSLSLLALVCGLVVYGWIHRRALEVKTGIDLNNDGRLGT